MQEYGFDKFVEVFPKVYKRQIELRNKHSETPIDLEKPRTALAHLRIMATMSDHMVEAISPVLGGMAMEFLSDYLGDALFCCLSS